MQVSGLWQWHPTSKGTWYIGGSESHKKGDKPGHCPSPGKEGRKITQNGRGSGGPALGVPVETRWCCSLNVFGSELFGYCSDIVFLRLFNLLISIHVQLQLYMHHLTPTTFNHFYEPTNELNYAQLRG